MAVPTYDQLIHPLLRVLGRHEEPIRARDARLEVADVFGVSEEDRTEMLPSGRQSVFDNRVGWAHDRLKRARLSESAKRGYWVLTSAGREFLRAHPHGLSDDEVAQLAQVEADSTASDRDGGVQQEGKVSGAGAGAGAAAIAEAAQQTSPQERLEAAFQELQDQVASNLLEQVRQVDPYFFERLVLDLLHAMGYGVTRRDLQQVGQSGDGGIDGVVNLDKLGLQKVYVQAKRWQDGNVVGRPEIQGFYGALAERRATYGVFITASSFSGPALRAAQSLSDTIVLIDGDRLVRLMMEHEIGVSTYQTFRVKRMDSDYFADE